MKKRILISIHPEHVKNILSGLKKYEYRKTIARQEVSSMLIYETSPTMKVVAEVEIDSVLTYPPEVLWKLTQDDSCISKGFFDSYFKERRFAHAYKLGKIKIFNKPKTLSEYGIKSAPQSFIYLE